MEHEFLSEAWVAALAERMKASEPYKKAGKGWRTTMAFALVPEADKGIAAAGAVMDLQDGEVRSVTHVAGPGPYEADYVIRGVAGKWKELLTKAIFPVPALMKGELQLVKGDNMSLMMKMGAAQTILDEAGAVPTRWPG